jgi:pilus assembly protein FimV
MELHHLPIPNPISSGDYFVHDPKAQLEPGFPAEVGQWSAGAQARRSITDFPEVQAMVDTLEGSDALLAYLKGLLLAPEPFDFSTYRDIVRAIGLAAEARKKDEITSMSLDFH